MLIHSIDAVPYDRLTTWPHMSHSLFWKQSTSATTQMGTIERNIIKIDCSAPTQKKAPKT